jgi:hypothetical protein
MTPFLPYSPNMRAGVVEVSSTQRSSVILPVTTPWYMRSMRCSTEPMPFGMARKSSRPSSFWPFMQNGQWSVDTIWMSLVRSACHMWCWWPSSRLRSGVEHTHLAPSNCPHSSLKAPSCSSSERYRYCGHVSPNTFHPWSRAQASWSTACFALTCTTYSGAPVRFASMIARCVASSSICQARAMPW